MSSTNRSAPRNQPVWLWWSGGKDSAWTLHTLRNDPRWDVRGLVTQVNRHNGRVAMHGVRRHMIERQAAAVGLPLHVIEFDWAATENDHNAAIEEGLLRLSQGNNGKSVAFSELLPGRAIKRRSALLDRIGLHPVFPLWGRDPAEHVSELLRAGVKAWVCSVETDRLPADRAGSPFDEDFVAALPRGVDPCGEDGEFHTFVEWAPEWQARVPAVPDGRIECYGFGFAEMEEAHAASEEQGVPGDSGSPRKPKEEQARHPKAGNDAFDYYARLRRVREHVDQHLEEHLDLKVLAPVAAMSAGGFGRFFREATGQSFHDWVVGRRLERAEILIRDHNEPIGRVAEAVGFGSERTFRRLFQRRFGCTPSRFRSQVRDVQA